MGTQMQKKKMTELEIMLSETYLNTNLNFSPKELTQLNLRMKDAEKYFNTSFTYYLYFNNSFFQDWISVLYENYSKKIESHISSLPFLLLVDFDDEIEGDEPTDKLDFEPLFTIIFEKLEINIITFFSLTNYNKASIGEFFGQLYENSYLFQLNRKFDSLCFLLSNTDYFIKDQWNVLYFGMKQLSTIDSNNNSNSNNSIYKTEHTPRLINKTTTKELYYNYYYETFLASKCAKSKGFKHFSENTLKKISPYYIKWSMILDISIETSLFVKSNTALFEMIDLLISVSSIVLLSAKLININATEGIAHNPNFELFLKNALTAFDQGIFNASTLVIKVYYEVKEQQQFIKDNSTIDGINAIIRNMINESFAYRYSNPNTSSNKRKLIIEVYQVLFLRRNKITSESLEDVKLMDVYDCLYYKEKSWHYWFIEQKDKKIRNWNAIYILFTDKLKYIGRNKQILLLIDKYLTIEHKYNSTVLKECGRVKESQFLYEFYS